jgi:hypothetical protein
MSFASKCKEELVDKKMVACLNLISMHLITMKIRHAVRDTPQMWRTAYVITRRYGEPSHCLLPDMHYNYQQEAVPVVITAAVQHSELMDMLLTSLSTPGQFKTSA